MSQRSNPVRLTTKRVKGFVCAGLLALLSACSSNGGGANPEEVIATVRTACQASQWDECFVTVDPDDRDLLLLAGGMFVSFTGNFNKALEQDLAAVLKEHGIEAGSVSYDLPNDMAGRRELATKIFGGVRDKPALFGELVRLLRQGAPAGTQSGTLGELSITKADDAEAVGSVDRSGKNVQVRLVNRDSSWYLTGESFLGLVF